MEEELNDPFPSIGPLPDRPLECSECRKEIAVRYSEIEKGGIVEVCMCNDCPNLQKRLQGVSKAPTLEGEGNKAGVACGDCGTTMDALRVGHPLGCSNCYKVFEATICHELLSLGKIPPNLDINNKSESLHRGLTPGEAPDMSLSLRLIALNETLNEALKHEDYEQAALIRDQINELTEKEGRKDIEENDGKK